jgi:hypothetical protein
LSLAPFARIPTSNIDRFLPTCVQHRKETKSVGCPESRRTMIETLTAVRSTSLPPARQYHGDRLIPTLHWMLAHPPLPVTTENRGAYPALSGTYWSGQMLLYTPPVERFLFTSICIGAICELQLTLWLPFDL